MDKANMGLRERKKRAVRATLSAVALRHALERGVSQVRVEDIAAEADVSPRTFNNYFPSKEAAIVGGVSIRSDQFCEILSRQPGEMPLHDALCATVLKVFEAEPDRDWIARSRLIRTEPSLFAEAAKADLAVEQSIAREVGRRTRTDPATCLAPRIAAATVVAAIHAAVEFWLDADHGSLSDVLAQAMERFRIADIDPDQSDMASD
ncbi:TetR family transcriptional regulator [Consotaella salsifontis]|nr:TetR family transcriptional regulator [Consotaella salsifontis]